jgi:hypothetical protein
VLPPGQPAGEALRARTIKAALGVPVPRAVSQPAVSNRHMEGCDACPGDGIIDQELMDRIHCQPPHVAAVGVDTVSPESALPRRLMLHAARLTSAPEARGQILAPPAGALEALEQDCTPIRTDMAHVEANGDLF